MRRIWSSIAMASGAVLALSTAGTAATLGLTLVSGPSPFARCTADAGTGTIYVNAEVEPYAAVNPADPSNLIAVWQQDRWSNGGAHGMVAGSSSNGGKSWSETPLPFDSCAPGGLNFTRASDPWVSIGPDGTAYVNALFFDGIDFRNGVAAATSTDGGKTWGNLVKLVDYESVGSQFGTDKNSITADPVKAGVAYSVWDTLTSPTDQPDDNPHASFAAAYTGPGYFSKTIDAGKTWSAAKIIFPTGNRNQTIGNQIVVDPSGTLYDFANLIESPNSVTKTNSLIAFVKSTDGGSSWTAPQVVTRMDPVFDFNAIGVVDPNTGQAIRTGDIIPEPAVDPVSGALYVAWQDSDFTNRKTDQIAITTSTDGGVRWSAPARVSVDTPDNRSAFTGTVKVNAAGHVAVTYYDFRNLQPGNTTTLPTDYWARVSKDGGTTFGPETHLAGSFDMLTAPNARGFFVGDYEGIGVSGNTFYPVFVQANSGNTTNRTDVFVTSLAG
jgi:hypothetical protein